MHVPRAPSEVSPGAAPCATAGEAHHDVEVLEISIDEVEGWTKPLRRRLTSKATSNTKWIVMHQRS
jgi:hypothetical protein